MAIKKAKPVSKRKPGWRVETSVEEERKAFFRELSANFRPAKGLTGRQRAQATSYKALLKKAATDADYSLKLLIYGDEWAQIAKKSGLASSRSVVSRWEKFKADLHALVENQTGVPVHIDDGSFAVKEGRTSSPGSLPSFADATRDQFEAMSAAEQGVYQAIRCLWPHKDFTTAYAHIHADKKISPAYIHVRQAFRDQNQRQIDHYEKAAFKLSEKGLIDPQHWLTLRRKMLLDIAEIEAIEAKSLDVTTGDTVQETDKQPKEGETMAQAEAKPEFNKAAITTEFMAVLKEARENQGLSQSELGLITQSKGVSTSDIKKLESVNSQFNVPLYKVNTIAEALGFEINLTKREI